MANEVIKAQIEAALFLTDKPLKAAVVARIVNADVNLTRQMIIELIHDYENRNGALEVADDDGYIIQVKDEYTHFTDEFVPIDMPTALIRTLSAIAIKQPVLQSEIIKLRGAGAYDHIKELLVRELINKREEGRSSLLTTTKKFQEYFRLSKDGKGFRQQFADVKPAGKGKQTGDESDVVTTGDIEMEIEGSVEAETIVAATAKSIAKAEAEPQVDQLTLPLTAGTPEPVVASSTEGETEAVVAEAAPTLKEVLEQAIVPEVEESIMLEVAKSEEVEEVEEADDDEDEDSEDEDDDDFDEDEEDEEEAAEAVEPETTEQEVIVATEQVIEAVDTASETLIEAVEEAGTFDFSPDPDAPPIGTAVEEEAEEEEETKTVASKDKSEDEQTLPGRTVDSDHSVDV